MSNADRRDATDSELALFNARMQILCAILPAMMAQKHPELLGRTADQQASTLMIAVDIARSLGDTAFELWYPELLIHEF